MGAGARRPSDAHARRMRPSATFSQSGRGSRFWTRRSRPAPRAPPEASPRRSRFSSTDSSPEASDAGTSTPEIRRARGARCARASATPRPWHKAAIATVDRGIHDHEVRCTTTESRAPARAKRIFDKTRNDAPRNAPRRGASAETARPRTRPRARDAEQTPAGTAEPTPGTVRARVRPGEARSRTRRPPHPCPRDAAKAAEIAAREAMAVATNSRRWRVASSPRR